MIAFIVDPSCICSVTTFGLVNLALFVDPSRVSKYLNDATLFSSLVSYIRLRIDSRVGFNLGISGVDGIRAPP